MDWRLFSQAAIHDGCVQGGLILKQAISNGITFGRSDWMEVSQPYFDDDHDRIFQEFKLWSVFQLFCFGSADPNVLCLKKMPSPGTGIEFLANDAGQFKRQGERLAEFCLELVDAIEAAETPSMQVVEGIPSGMKDILKTFTGMPEENQNDMKLNLFLESSPQATAKHMMDHLHIGHKKLRELPT